jgi:hypothetical protein
MKNFAIMQVIVLVVLFAAMATRFAPLTPGFGGYVYIIHSVIAWWLFWSAIVWTSATYDHYHKGIKDKIYSIWLINIVYWVVFHWLLFNGEEPHWWDHLAAGVTICLHFVLTWFLGEDSNERNK